MPTTIVTASASRSNRWSWLGHPVITGGLLAGVLDIVAAFALTAWYGGSALRMLQGIASGVLGPAAFRGGPAPAVLGLAVHFVIACGAAAVYYGVSRSRPGLVRHTVLAGLAYGVLVYVVMNAIVLPLSRVERSPSSPWTVAILIVIHMGCVGLPIAFATRRATRRAAAA